MKISFFLFFITLINTYASTYSQNTKITLDLKDVKIEHVLDEIESLSEFNFIYDDAEVDFRRIVSIKAKKSTIAKILKKIFNDSDITFNVIDKQIILKKREYHEIPTTTTVELQQVNVKGTVRDSDGNPLPGVSVLIVGTTKGVLTDFNGVYAIPVDVGQTLEFSYLGLKTQRIQVSTSTTIDVTMEADVSNLNEVVVTALGIKRQKRDLGFATQGIKGSTLVESSSPDLMSALSGQIAGVNVSIPDGVEGSSTRIVIRGNNSITGDNQPLIIIDGVPQSNDFIERNNFGGYTDWGTALNNINSFDIETMDVLKGPAAAALYGARGSNGVILITTKKGRKEEGIGISYSNRYRITEATRYRDVQNVFGSGGPILANDGEPSLPTNGSGENILPGVWGTSTPQHTGGGGLGGRATWADFSWYASSVSWGPRMEGQMVRWWDGEMRPFSPQPDNIKSYFETGTNQEHNVSFSTAGDMGSVRFSLTNLEHESVIPNSEYSQTTANLGGTVNISSKLSADYSLTYFEYSRLNSPVLGDANNSFGKATLYYYPRNYKVLDKYNYENEDGSRNPLNGYGGVMWGNSQYLWWTTYNNNTTLNRNKMLGSLSVNYKATDWMNVMARVGIDETNEDIALRRKPTDQYGLLSSNYKRDLLDKSIKNLDVLATFHKDQIVKDVNASLSLGGTSWSQSNYGLGGDRKGKPTAYPDQYSFANIEDITQIRLSEVFYDKKINSLYGFLNLSYKDYLFLQVTGRNDWSSTLPKESNSYFYPSANLSFIVSDAYDLSSLDWLSFAKIRMAYSKTAIDTYPYRTGAVYNTGNFGGNPTVSLPGVIPPLGLKPQITNSYEFGFNLGLLNNKINLDFTYYKANSFDQILSSPIPISSGSNQFVFNTGELENNGIEIQLNADVMQKGDFSWDATVNYARNKNYVVALDEKAEYLELANQWGVYGPSVRVKAGEQYGAIYGYDYLRNANGEKLVSDDGHHYLTTSDKVILGNATPDFVGGINNTFRYKNFSLGVNVDTKWGGDVFAGTYAVSLYNGHSPATIKERLGGGLPYTSQSDGVTRNIGVILDGVHANGTPNTTVVHPIWKYMGNMGSAWGDRTALVDGSYQKYKFLHREMVIDNSWVKLRQVALSYNFPRDLIQKTKVFQSLNLSVVGRDLLYIYQNMPDNINPEGLANVGNAQGVEWGSLPGFSSFTIGINATF